MIDGRHNNRQQQRRISRRGLGRQERLMLTVEGSLWGA